MERVEIGARPNWRERAEEAGFAFHTMHGEPYWDESSAYRFTLRQVEEDIEDPCTELHAMCREAAARIVASEELMERLAVPREHWDLVRGSWERGEPELYGRFDLIYDGAGPAKMIEYNADTPTSLFETASFQWDWLEAAREAGLIPEGSDQLNSLYEALADRWRAIMASGDHVHFAAVKDMPEDYATVETMAYAARDAGLGAHYSDLEAIGFDPDGRLVDGEAQVIGTLFKLYPWEDWLRDDEAEALLDSNTRFIEPLWKAVASNKAILPVLWEMFPGHENLLPAHFEGAPDAPDGYPNGTVRKPIFSREGGSVDITGPNGAAIESAPHRAYDAHPRIVQAYHPLPDVGGFHPVMGAWIVGEACVALGIREDRSRITGNLSRFKPHYIEPAR